MQNNRGFKQIAAKLAAILAAGALQSAEVGIYVAAADGGKSVGNMAIKNTLADAGITVDEFSSMSMANLLQFRAVIIPNTPVLAQHEDPRWSDNLRAYVSECGGAIIFNHDAIGAERSPFGQLPLFPEIVAPGSVERAAAAKIKIVVPDALNADFDYLPGYQAGQEAAHMYSDHFMFEQNGGTALLADIATEKIVAAAGTVGAGRVVFNGLFGGHPAGLAAALEGLDRELMLNTVKWCLAGKGLVITDPARAKVSEWRPEITGMTAARNRIAMIGSAGFDIRNRVVPKIERSGLAVDFIPVHFLNVRDLSPDDYKLILFFAPLRWEEDHVPAATFEKINRFTQAGGKAIIFLQGGIGKKVQAYLLDPAGITPAGQLVRDNPANLRAVEWTDTAGHTRRVKEIPDNWITPLGEPEAGKAQTIGYWLDYKEERRSPAIFRTGYGYLLNLNIYGDCRMFLADAAAALLPESAPDIFNKLLQEYQANVKQTGDRAFSGPGRNMRTRADELRGMAAAAAAAGEHAQAIQLILQAESELVRAYAVSMPAAQGEERIVFTFARSLPDPEIICARLAGAGFTGIAVTHLEGHYPSKLYGKNVQPGETHPGADDTDWMQKWVDTAHKHGLKIGPSFSAFSVYAGSPEYARAMAEDWRVVPGGQVGKPPKPFPESPRLDPCRSRREVPDYAIAKAREIIERYPVDYIFYDYIRWSETCYCNYCMEKFQQDTGVKIEKWPDDVMGKYQEAYNDWRARPVTRVIRTTAANIAGINPQIKLGVFTFRGQRESWGKGQYWWEWTNDTDYVMPMVYAPDNRTMEELFIEINGLLPAGGRARLLPALAPPGVKGGSDLTRLQQLDLQRQYAPAGAIYFSYYLVSDAFLDWLRMGPWRD